jgi:F-type H+-transporting ATPase subunit gamma
MPSIKEYTDKLKSLKNTQKMTKTMKMVSASKLRRAQDAQKDASVYAERLTAMIARLAASVPDSAHALLEGRPVKKVLLVAFSSDRGLCGGFNNNLIKMITRYVEEQRSEYEQVDLMTAGRRVNAWFRNRENVVKDWEDSTAKPDFSIARAIADDVAERFLSGEYDEIRLVYNKFHSPLAQTPMVTKLLPVDASVLEGGEAVPSDYIYEPALNTMLEELLPRAVSFRVFNAFLENSAGEHGARMTAMDNATNNASDLIREYTLRRNRARQAAITTELTEIVAGAEAL